MGPKSKDRLWKIRYRLRLWWTSEGQRWREQRAHFYRMTGLHPVWTNRGPVSDLEIIALQARKIKGLEQFIADQRKGYLRKVARLEKQLADPTRTPQAAGSPNPGMPNENNAEPKALDQETP